MRMNYRDSHGHDIGQNYYTCNSEVLTGLLQTLTYVNGCHTHELGRVNTI